MTQIIIYGAHGKMGQALLQSLTLEKNLGLVAALGSQDAIEPILSAADVVIDFSTPEATLPLVEKCAHARKALVIGTTGHSTQMREKNKNGGTSYPTNFFAQL